MKNLFIRCILLIILTIIPFSIQAQDTEMQVIYKLTSPYTVGLTIPKLNVAFGTSAAFMSYKYTDDKCIISPFYPKVKITITV